MKKGLIGLIVCILGFMSLNAYVKTYIYNPLNPQSYITQIYIDTDGKVYTKDVNATLVRLDSNYILPAATTTVRGGVNAGLGLTMSGDSIGVALHGVSGVAVSNDTISCTITAGTGLTRNTDDIVLDLASTSARGGIKIGYGVTMTGDSLGLSLSGTTQSFTTSDLTPTVAGYTCFFTANSGTTTQTITDFDNAVDGQIITVIAVDSNTTFDFTSSSLIGSSADIRLFENDVLTFIYALPTEKWYLKSFVNASADNSSGF